ncbi:hypothetical protein [Candidatus Pelagibacter sp. HIMB1782]|uniref:hypothetical protein n=1 Tax=Candidatus Pelagibacter sp. HIMB1782 TaxID=3413375 RepID=UPI003F86B996
MFYKKIIFLECDLGGRDAKIYLTLSKFLENKISHAKVYLISRINIKFFITNFKNSIFILTPQKINRYKTHKSNLFYILETEGFLNKELYHLTYQRKNLQNIKKIFVWNNLTKKNLVTEYKVSKENVSVIGPFRLVYLSILKKNINKFTVGVLCRNVGLSNFKNISKIKFIYDYIQLEKKNKVLGLKEHWSFQEIIENNIKSVENIIKILDYYNDKKININIRPHPNENFKDYIFLENKYTNVKIDRSENFYDWIENVDIVFTPSSSTNIDLILSNIPLIDLKGNYKKETFLNLHKQLSHKVDFNNIKLTIKDLKKIRASKNNKLFDQFKKKYLNNCNIDFSHMVESLKKESSNLPSQHYWKLIIYDFYNNFRYLLACLYKREKIDFNYNFSYVFKKYSINQKLLNKFNTVKFKFY